MATGIGEANGGLGARSSKWVIRGKAEIRSQKPEAGSRKRQGAKRVGALFEAGGSDRENERLRVGQGFGSIGRMRFAVGCRSGSTESEMQEENMKIGRASCRERVYVLV